MKTGPSAGSVSGATEVLCAAAAACRRGKRRRLLLPLVVVLLVVVVVVLAAAAVRAVKGEDVSACVVLTCGLLAGWDGWMDGWMLG